MGQTKNNIVLIGFMGSGKTTVGQLLAKNLGYRFLDTDEYIEQTTGKTISTIFATYGEEYFRLLETKIVEELATSLSNTVVSTGGGLPLREKNANILKGMGQVIFLKISKEVVLNRLQGDTNRPLLQGENVEERVENLLTERFDKYKKAAHYMVCVDQRSEQEVMEHILAQVKLLK